MKEDNEAGRRLLDLLGYEKSSAAAKRLGISQALFRRYCNDGRVEGAAMLGNRWYVPQGSKIQQAEKDFALNEEQREYARTKQREWRARQREMAAK